MTSCCTSIQSPSIELFLSIVEFHSSPESCAKFIMDRVDRLSLKIISDASGQLHKEVDYSFVIGIMKQLILNAKLKFAESGDSSGVELCDTYVGCGAGIVPPLALPCVEIHSWMNCTVHAYIYTYIQVYIMLLLPTELLIESWTTIPQSHETLCCVALYTFNTRIRTTSQLRLPWLVQ